MVNACASVFLWCGIGVSTRVTDSAFSTSAPRAYGQPLTEVIIDEHREQFGEYFMSLNLILIFKTFWYTSQIVCAYFKNVKCKTWLKPDQTRITYSKVEWWLNFCIHLVIHVMRLLNCNTLKVYKQIKWKFNNVNSRLATWGVLLFLIHLYLHYVYLSIYYNLNLPG